MNNKQSQIEKSKAFLRSQWFLGKEEKNWEQRQIEERSLDRKRMFAQWRKGGLQ